MTLSAAPTDGQHAVTGQQHGTVQQHAGQVTAAPQSSPVTACTVVSMSSALVGAQPLHSAE